MNDVVEEKNWLRNFFDDDNEEDIENKEWEFANKQHWYNTQNKFLKKREFWRAVIYALTRPEPYKPILLEKAKHEKELVEIALKKISEYKKHAVWFNNHEDYSEEE